MSYDAGPPASSGWIQTKRVIPKYRNQQTNGYASKREAKRAQELKLLLKAGRIRNLKEQETFQLVVNGIKVCAYRCDFSYEENGAFVVEDVKSPYTAKLPVYRLKRALMKACLGIEIKEV